MYLFILAYVYFQTIVLRVFKYMHMRYCLLSVMYVVYI